jgi:hypothetical protein
MSTVLHERECDRRDIDRGHGYRHDQALSGAIGRETIAWPRIDCSADSGGQGHRNKPNYRDRCAGEYRRCDDQWPGDRRRFDPSGNASLTFDIPSEYASASPPTDPLTTRLLLFPREGRHSANHAGEGLADHRRHHRQHSCTENSRWRQPCGRARTSHPRGGWAQTRHHPRHGEGSEADPLPTITLKSRGNQVLGASA